MGDQLIFLGTGDSMGVPRVYCSCSVCEEARTSGGNRRYRSSALLRSEDDELLIDCGPDWTAQMETMGIKETRHVLVTHAHFDHIGGLPEWADACRWLGVTGHLYGPTEVLDTIRLQFPWLPGRLRFYSLEEAGMTFAGWTIRPWKVCHGRNGFSYAYRLEKGRYAWAYCSDSIRLTEEQKVPLRGLDLLVLGTSFYREEADPATRSVYDMVEAAELIGEAAPAAAIFTHMSHGVDLAAAYPLPGNVRLAAAGMAVELG